jgi:hypothetical protein
VSKPRRQSTITFHARARKRGSALGHIGTFEIGQSQCRFHMAFGHTLPVPWLPGARHGPVSLFPLLSQPPQFWPDPSMYVNHPSVRLSDSGYKVVVSLRLDVVRSPCRIATPTHSGHCPPFVIVVPVRVGVNMHKVLPAVVLSLVPALHLVLSHFAFWGDRFLGNNTHLYLVKRPPL